MIDSDEAPPRSDPMLIKLQDLEEIAAKLLETARKLHRGKTAITRFRRPGDFVRK